MLLSETELRDWTHQRAYKKQAAWLAAHGVQFMPRADGTLAVARAEFDLHMLSRQVKKATQTEPNLSALS